MVKSTDPLSNTAWRVKNHLKKKKNKGVKVFSRYAGIYNQINNKYYDIHKDIDDIIGWSITR